MTLFHALGPFAAQAGVVAAPGMVLLTPTSIAHSGTSASIGANGQVTFTAVTSLSLNGVFSADFDNYVLSFRHYQASGNNEYRIRYRVGGADATGGNYTDQRLTAAGTTVAAERATNTSSARVATSSDNLRSADTIFVYGPFLTQPTAGRAVASSGRGGGAEIIELAHTHSLSTSYDGFTLFPDASSLTGALQVYGVRS